MEDAAKTVADEITYPRPAGHEEVHDIQLILIMGGQPMSIRKIKVAAAGHC